MFWYRQLSIGHKLALAMLLSTFLLLIASAVIMIVYDFSEVREAEKHKALALGRIIETNVAQAVESENPSAGDEMLSSLRENREVACAAVFASDGTLFAHYLRSDITLTTLPKSAPLQGLHERNGTIELSLPITDRGKTLGFLYLRYELLGWMRHFRGHIHFLGILLVVYLLLTIPIYRLIQKWTTLPILQLVEATRRISEEKDYSVRVDASAKDEIGMLAHSFNMMLAEIEKRDAMLQNVNAELELRVQERTRELELEIAEHKKTEAELLQTRQAALDASRLKSQFLANMSHEIRTPMNGIIGMTELLQQTRLTPEQEEYVQAAKTSAETLLSIINDILDFSKIEAGKMTIEQVDFNLRDIVEEVGAIFAQRAHEKGIELLTVVPPDLPVCLRGDPVRIKQILMNLTSNGVKFTEKGEVVIGAEAVYETDSLARIRLSVKDTGIGIPPEVQQVIFESFTQADGSVTRRYGGTGLGLTISRQLAELMGGTIGVQSEPGKGSIFWIELSLPKSERQCTLDLASRKQEISNLRVLVVDDNATNRRILREHLQSWGCSVQEAENGKAALEMLIGEHPPTPFDVVVLDYQMYEMDGLELARRIRSTQLPCKLIMLSSIGPSTQGSNENSIDVWLTKPVRRSQLYNSLCEILGLGLETSARVVPAIERRRSGVRVLLVEDNEVNRKLALRMLQRLGCSVEVAINGREALEKVSSRAFDMVFMDVQMPELDGLEATRRIRETEASLGKHLPIIAMTAHALESDRERCLSAGMDDYLSKPVKIERLAEMVEKWAPLRRRAQAPLSENGATESLARDVGWLIGEMMQAVQVDDIQYAGDLCASVKRLCVAAGYKQGEELCDRLRAQLGEKPVAELLSIMEELKGSFGMHNHSNAEQRGQAA